MAGSAWSNQAVIASLVEIITGSAGSGLFVYNGTPAKGTLVVAFAPTGSTDPFGNVYPSGFNFGTWDGTGTLKRHFGLDIFGNVYVGSSNSVTVDYIDSSNGAVLGYNASGQSSGNLITSIAPVAGTDPAGNTYPQGLNVTTGTISGTAISASSISSTTFSGVNFVINTQGAFFYSGTPASGNLICSVAPASGADVFGNTFTAGVQIASGAQLIAGNLIINFAGLFVYGASPFVTQKATSGTSFTIPAVLGGTVIAECWGGGGGGGTAANFGAAGAGGGEYAKEPSLAVTSPGTVTYAVGAGGTGGVFGGAASTSGGNSTITGSSVTVTANGGIKGTQQTPGAGGSGSTNTTHHPGGAGGGVGTGAGDGGGGGSSAGPSNAGNPGTASSAPQSAGTGGNAVTGGGAGGNGGGQATQLPPLNGFAGGVPGGGGGGSAAGYNGGNGAGGQVQITYQPATNALLFSFASSSGTDAFGNAFPAGLYVNDTVTLKGILTPSAPAAGNALLFADTSGFLRALTGLAGDTNNYFLGQLPLFTNGTQLINSTTPATIAGLSAPVGIGTYRVDGIVFGAQGANAAAQKVQFNGPTTNFARMYIESNADANTSVTDSNLSGAFPEVHTTPAWGAGVNFYVRFKGIYTFTASGTFSVQGAANSSSNPWTSQAACLLDIRPVI